MGLIMELVDIQTIRVSRRDKIDDYVSKIKLWFILYLLNSDEQYRNSLEKSGRLEKVVGSAKIVNIK